MKKDLPPLEPVDMKRCQAEAREYHPFRLGPPHTTTRCKNRATHVITEKNPGADGRCGAMSVCSACLAEFRGKSGRPAVLVQPIVRKVKTTRVLALGDPL